MGKSKKTRWRALDLDGGSQDETLSSDATPIDAKFHNGTSDAVTSHKYSQILGDHHNTSNNNNSTTSTSAGYSSSNGKAPFTSYSRSKVYNNKENYYNQRSLAGGRAGAHKSWQRGSGSYRSTFYAAGRDRDIKRPEEGGENAGKDANASDTTTPEPKKFNEDEYTRITTPRQDVLFKKGYLSRNINKTATTLTTSNSVETAASSSATDPDSSVSTLSPATTPSMEYGGNQTDPMDPYGQMYYPPGGPCYYDDMLVMPYPVPFNGYPSYYPTSPGSPGSPMILMPYNPYSIDPFFMPPDGVGETDEGEQQQQQPDEKATTEADEKEPNEQENEATNHSGAGAASDSSSPISTSDAGATESNNHEEAGEGGDEAEEEESDEGKKQIDDQLAEPAVDTLQSDEKPELQYYSSELLHNYRNLFPDPTEKCQPPTAEYGNFIYPAYAPPSEYYSNGVYYCDARPPPRFKRRKRFPSYRNQQPRSTETTTDDENTTSHNSTRYSNYKYQSGAWQPRYFYDRSRVDYWDQNRNNIIAAQNGFHFNADVKEFYPQTKVEVPAPAQVDEVKPTTKSETKVAAKPSQPAQVAAPIAKTQKVTKREIMQGIKSMEQQNIDLMATKHTLAPTTSAPQDDDEWNVIMKGKKVKIVRDESSTRAKEVKVAESKVEPKTVEVKTAVQPSIQPPSAHENVKKSQSSAPNAPAKVTNNSKKSKSKGKKKKPNLMVKQDGFEIIEPEFAKPLVVVNDEETNDDAENDVLEPSDIESTETLPVDVTINQEDVTGENQVLLTTYKDIEKSDECIKEASADAGKPNKSEKETIVIETSPIDLTNMHEAQKAEEIDTVIDISDEDICSAKVLLSLEKEIENILDNDDVDSPPSPPRTSISSAVIETPIAPPTVVTDVKQSAPEEPTLETTIEHFNDRVNIAELERDVIENLRQLGADEDIELKCPIINPLYDFPITSAVQKWLQAKQHESFENLFHMQNLKKLYEIYDEDEHDEVDDDEETESDISEKELKSETDSDYASDFHAKTNGNSPTCSNHAKASSRSLNSKLIATKESFCALM